MSPVLPAKITNLRPVCFCTAPDARTATMVLMVEANVASFTGAMRVYAEHESGLRGAVALEDLHFSLYIRQPPAGARHHFLPVAPEDCCMSPHLRAVFENIDLANRDTIPYFVAMRRTETVYGARETRVTRIERIQLPILVG